MTVSHWTSRGECSKMPTLRKIVIFFSVDCNRSTYLYSMQRLNNSLSIRTIRFVILNKCIYVNLKKKIFLKPGHLRNPIVQDAHRMGILEQWELNFKKWCDNHAYSGLMQWIICELSNLSNKLKDNKATQNTRSKNAIAHVLTACHTFFVFISVFLV